MIWNPRKRNNEHTTDFKEASPHSSPVWKVAIEGTVVGIVTGFVGVGGGFLIVPALVVMGNLPMRQAIGTSLVIIAIKSAVGFAKYEHYLLEHELSVDGTTILVFALIGVFGSLVGQSLNKRLDQQTLRRVFATFLIVLGGLVIVREGKSLISEQFSTQTTLSRVVQAK